MKEFQARAEEIIKSYEGFSGKAYWDVDKWAIGYGFRDGVTKDSKMTKEEADKRMSQEVVKYADSVERHVTNKNITDEQRAALTSFAYNVGIGAFEKSTLLKKVNEGDIEGATAEFSRWTKAGGKVDKGLIRRRQQEAAVFSGKENKDAETIRSQVASAPKGKDVKANINDEALSKMNGVLASLRRSEKSQS